MTTRIGVIADTHCPEFRDRLPARIFGVLDGVDLILHAGDIVGEETLVALRRVAPVKAVRGDHDGSLGERRCHARSTSMASASWSCTASAVTGSRAEHARLDFEPRLLQAASGPAARPQEEIPRCRRDRLATRTWRVPKPSMACSPVQPGRRKPMEPATATQRLTQHPGWFEWCWLQVARHMRRFRSRRSASSRLASRASSARDRSFSV